MKNAYVSFFVDNEALVSLKSSLKASRGWRIFAESLTAWRRGHFPWTLRLVSAFGALWEAVGDFGGNVGCVIKRIQRLLARVSRTRILCPVL